MRNTNCVSMFALGVVMVAGYAVHASIIDDTAVNAMCPIGKEPIVHSAGAIEYKGNTIGFCCPGCGKAFLAWDEIRKDAFVTMAKQGHEPGVKESDAEATTPDTGEASNADSAKAIPYPFNECLVADAELGSMGEPVVKVYDGREVKFCCAGCIGTFEADMALYFEKLDNRIIADQMRYYPTDACIVMGDHLTEVGENTAINIVHNNRLIRLCCTMCAGKFNENPDMYISELDALVTAAQRDEYPLESCIVAETELGSMGEPTEVIVAGRLLRFCCAACEPKVESDPLNYVAAIDKAWQAIGRFKTNTEHN